jgi:hypothetical protein
VWPLPSDAIGSMAFCTAAGRGMTAAGSNGRHPGLTGSDAGLELPLVAERVEASPGEASSGRRWVDWCCACPWGGDASRRARKRMGVGPTYRRAGRTTRGRNVATLPLPFFLKVEIPLPAHIDTLPVAARSPAEPAAPPAVVRSIPLLRPPQPPEREREKTWR